MKGSMGEALIRLQVLAEKFNVSVSTMRRYLDQLHAEGYITWEYAPRKRYGGRLRRYFVAESTLREVFGERFIDKRLKQEQASEATSDDGQSKRIDSELEPTTNKLQAPHSSVVYEDEISLDDLLQVARNLYINGRPASLNDSQRGFLVLAARKYGVTKAWYALQRAVEAQKYSPDELIRIVWAILKKSAA